MIKRLGNIIGLPRKMFKWLQLVASIRQCGQTKEVSKCKELGSLTTIVGPISEID